MFQKRCHDTPPVDQPEMWDVIGCDISVRRPHNTAAATAIVSYRRIAAHGRNRQSFRPGSFEFDQQ